MKLKWLSQLVMIASILPAMAVAANYTLTSNNGYHTSKQASAYHTSSTNDTIYMEDKPNISISAQHPEFTLQLKSNPTTGYAWFLRDYDSHFIVPIKHSFQAGNAKLLGAPGYEFWTFQVKPDAFVVPHQLTIRFVYIRPWQSTDNGTQMIFRITTEK